jgi:integrase/recombinase XerC
VKESINHDLLVTISNFLEYLEKERFYSKCTIKTYYYTLTKFVADMVLLYPEINSWNMVTNNIVRHVIRNTHKRVDDNAISNRSRAHLVSVLKSFYRYLVIFNIVKDNLMLNIKIPKFGIRLPQYLSYEQFTQLVELPKNPSNNDLRQNAIIELLFASGIRVSELTNIDISDIDFQEMEFRVIGKGNKERIVPFGSYALKAIKEWLSVRDNYGPKCGKLFINRFGNKLSTRAIELMMQKLGSVRNIPLQITPHKLRHTFATEMLAGGADLRVVQEILGHSNLGVTQVYLHLDEQRLRKAYESAHPLVIGVKNDDESDNE